MQENNTYSGMERLSGDYNRGYTQTITDVREIFNYIEDDLKSHHKKFNSRYIRELLHCILMNREQIRESKRHEDTIDEFIRYNKQADKFEYYKPKKLNWVQKNEKKTETTAI